MILRKDMQVAVLLPEQPEKTERFAGEELKKYLEKIFGGLLFTERKEDAQVIFVIGGPERNLAARQLINEGDFAERVPGPEGFLLQIAESAVLLAGSDGTGTLYAVYTFLEEVLGCCFGAFPLPHMPVGETIPAYEEKELGEQIRCKPAADLPYRTAIVQFGEVAGEMVERGLTRPFIDYLAKNRYNRILTWISIYRRIVELGLVDELQKRGIRLTVGHHEALGTFMPYEGNEEFPTPYGKTNPEFFRVLPNGQRQTSQQTKKHFGQWLLCSRSEGCIAEMAKNLNGWLEKNPVVDTIALWPNDGVARQCQCGLCSKHSKMENYLYFLNEVAKRLKAAHKERKVDVIVYLDLWGCPKDTRLSDNIVVDVAAWTATGLRHCGKPDGSTITATHICDNMHAYHKAGSRTVLYDYYMGNYGNRQAVMPAADEMQSVFRYFKAAGFDGSGTQMECFNQWNNLFNFYCFARTEYDTDLSVEQNMQDISRLFGEGAESVCRILRQYEQTLDGEVPINETGKFFAEHVAAETVYDLFEAALARASTPLFRNNIRMLRMAFRYTMLLQYNTPEAEREIGAMASFFDSFHVNDPGCGIAITGDARTSRLPEDPWYCFEQ